MKAILVNAILQTVSAITIDSWRDIAPALECDMFTVPGEDNEGNSLYADDEGLISGKELHFVFCPDFYPAPIAGNILFLGTDSEGESRDCTLTVEDIKRVVSFPSLSEVQKIAREMDI